MTDPKKHAENVEALVDRLRGEGVPATQEETVVIIKGDGSGGGDHHTTSALTEDGVSDAYDVVLDVADWKRKDQK